MNAAITLAATESIKRAYDHNPELRPFPIPLNGRYGACEKIYDDLCLPAYLRVIEEGLDVSLVEAYPTGLAQCMDNYSQIVPRLMTAYPEGHTVRVEIDSDRAIVSQLRTRFKVNCHTPSRSRDYVFTIDRIMNIIVNSGSHIINSESPLLSKYLRVMGIKEQFHTYKDVVPNRPIIDHYINYEIEDINDKDIDNLLTSALFHGYRSLVERIYKSGYSQSGKCSNLIGYHIAFRLIESYPLICADVKLSFLEFINLDYNLDYCNRSRYQKYWDVINVKKVTNINGLKLLRDRGVHIPTVNELLDRSRLALCDRLVPLSQEVDDKHIIRLIERLSDTNNMSIMSLLLTFHLNGLIKLNNYYGLHSSIDFIIERMKIVKVKRINQA